MLAKRIIPCLDVKAGKVVKGVQFRNHVVVGDIVDLAQYYVRSGADELVFYDISASSDNRLVAKAWVSSVAQLLSIPFCVAGGIRSCAQAECILNAGADKISINSPALENPKLINELVNNFGSQCVVVGIDSLKIDNQYHVLQYTGNENKIRKTNKLTKDWVQELQSRGAGEIVLNCMNQDGMRKGYDLEQLAEIRALCHVPLIASGGAGAMNDFAEVFKDAKVDGALAASVFHRKEMGIGELKQYLNARSIQVRI